MTDYETTIEAAGAEYIGVRDGVVTFRCRESDAVLKLYAFAVTPENVSLALKAAREPQPVGFEPLARAEGL